MTRAGSGLLGVVRGLTVAGALLALAGCAPKPAELDDGAARERAAIESSEEVNTVSVADVPAADAVLALQGKSLLDHRERGPERFGVGLDREIGEGFVAEFG